MNTIHMTEQDWALYIQTFEPKNIEEANVYLDDLVAYSKTGNFESGIARCRVVRLFVDYPELQDYKARNIEFNNRFEQTSIQEKFKRNKI